MSVTHISNKDIKNIEKRESIIDPMDDSVLNKDDVMDKFPLEMIFDKDDKSTTTKLIFPLGLVLVKKPEKGVSESISDMIKIGKIENFKQNMAAISIVMYDEPLNECPYKDLIPSVDLSTLIDMDESSI
jgi:hypothetical protein